MTGYIISEAQKIAQDSVGWETAPREFLQPLYVFHGPFSGSWFLPVAPPWEMPLVAADVDLKDIEPPLLSL